MLLRMAILHLILYITIKRGGIRGYMKSMGDRLGRREKAKGGAGKEADLWDWIKSKMIDIYFYTGGHRIINSQQ